MAGGGPGPLTRGLRVSYTLPGSGGPPPPTDSLSSRVIYSEAERRGGSSVEGAARARRGSLSQLADRPGPRGAAHQRYPPPTYIRLTG